MTTEEAATGGEWSQEGSALVWRRAYGPWVVRAVTDTNAPFYGPSTLTIHLAAGGSDDEIDQAMAEAQETDGIPAALLRQVPFAKIKAESRALVSRADSTEAALRPWPVPARCHSETDYALLVGELYRMRKTGTTAPQGELAARLGIGKATMSERVKRAKELDLWDGKTPTTKAFRLLAELEHQEEQSKEP
ncbi:hypothetical protein ACFCYI_24720 [Streptomyces sp. NPDC056257]|uniref:hypothetical protein n=1 Tax=Streptomyces sp. NPDC056257 TaxID=3345765 RepID=UPI0035D58F55